MSVVWSAWLCCSIPGSAIAAVPAPATVTKDVTLCLAVPAEIGVPLEELAAATAAQIAHERIRVVSCRERLHPYWLVRVTRESADRLAMTIQTQRTTTNRSLAVTHLAPQDVVFLVALSIAEEVRPTLDVITTLRDLELLDLSAARDAAADRAPPGGEQADGTSGALSTPASGTSGNAIALPVDALTEQRHSVLPAPLAGASTDRWAASGSCGPLIGLPAGLTSALVTLGGRLQLGALGVAVRVGLGNLPTSEREPWRLSGWEIQGGVGGWLQWQRVGLGLELLGRVTRLALAQAGRPAPDGPRLFFTAGLGLHLEAELWRPGPWELGLAAQLSWWPWPHRFFMHEQLLLRQASSELWLGPVARFWW